MTSTTGRDGAFCMEDQNLTTVIAQRHGSAAMRLTLIGIARGGINGYLTPAAAAALRDWITAWLDESADRSEE